MSKKKPSEILELTSIRFFAAFFVLLYHNIYLLNLDSSFINNTFKNFVSFGDSAVTFFFILSGFILTYVYYNESERAIKGSKFNFWLHRFARIYPVYILGYILDFNRGSSYFLLKYTKVIAIKKIIISSMAYFFMIQSWHPRLSPVWNSPGWSLSTEAFFYFSFPLLISILEFSKKNITLMFIMYLIPIAIYLYIPQMVNIDNPEFKTLWRSLPLIRITEFIIGILICKIYFMSDIAEIFQKKKTKGTLFFGCITTIFFVTTLIKWNIDKVLLSSIVLVPIYTLLIFFMVTIKLPIFRILRNKQLVLLGKASFTIYITHQPIKDILIPILEYYKFSKGVTLFGIYSVTVCLLSIIIYNYIEIPLQKLILKKLKPKH